MNMMVKKLKLIYANKILNDNWIANFKCAVTQL